MKKNLKLVVTSLIMLTMITGCGGSSTVSSIVSSVPVSSSEDLSVKGVTLNVSSASLKVGESTQLIATITPENARNKALTWESDNDDVAMVSGVGKVKAIAPGTAHIKVSSNENPSIYASCEIVVTEEDKTIHVSSIAFSKPELTLNINGQAGFLEVVYYPDNADAKYKNVTWEMDKQGIISVNNGIVTPGSQVGDVVVTATCPDGNHQTSITVHVIDPVTHVESVELNKDSLDLIVGQHETLVATVSPAAADNKNIVWSIIGTEGVAFVDQNGKVSALGSGTVTVRATSAEDNTIYDECELTVDVTHVSEVGISGNNQININSTTVISATVAPEDAADKSLTWHVEDDKVLEVISQSNNNATFKGLKVGSSKVWAVATDGSIKSNELVISVVDPVKHVTGISLNKTSTDLIVGASETLVATIAPSDADNKGVIWSALNNDDVISVNSNGKISALKPGTATVRATSSEYDSVYAECTVTVDNIHVSSVSISGNTEVNLQDLTTINAAISPSDAENKNITWTLTGNESGYVQIISQSNTNIVLKGLLVGQVTLKATATDGSVDSNVMTISVVDPVKHVTGISLNKTSTDLIVGGSETLVATIAPNDADNKGVIWTALDNDGVISVDNNGKISALKPGTATVRATSSEYSTIYAECTVTVDKIHVSSVTISGNGSFNLGSTTVINAVVAPSDAANKNITWTIADDTIVQIVTQSNTSVVLSGIKAGTTTIKATAQDGSIDSNVIDIEVIDTTVYVTGVSLNKNTLELIIGNQGKLIATVSPTDATNKEVEWISDDSSVATVDSLGNVTAVKEGTVTISCISKADSTKFDTCEVTVSKPAAVKVSSITIPDTLNINLNSSEHISAVILPANAENQAIEWTIVDSTVASIAQNFGSTIQLNGLKVGTTTIYATAKDGGGAVSNVCTITVVDPVIHVTSVSLNKNLIDYTTADTGEKLIATVLPATATYQGVTWASSNPSVIHVSDQGQLTIIGVGTAIISATSVEDPTKYDTCVVNVDSIHVTSVTISGSSSVDLGDTITINAVVAPSDAANKNITWILTGNSGYAQIVSQNNTSIVLKGLAVGEFTLKATATDGSVDSNVMTISVVDPVKHVTGISLNKTSTDLIVGGSETLVATITPSDADNKGVIWTIPSDNGVISIDNNGKITALKVGTATVRATSSEYSTIYAECTVTVDVIHVTGVTISGNTEVNLQDLITINAAISPSDAENKNITWTVSGNESGYVQIVSQSNTSIVLKGLLVGQVTLKATATDGSVDSNVMTISVVDPVKHVTGISLNKTSTDLIVGGSETLVATIAPSDADNKGVIWTIPSDNGVISIDNNGKITALKVGTATVRATSSEYSTIYAECTVTVDVIHVTGVTISGSNSVNLEQIITINATVAPSDAANKNITWTVSGNESGYVQIVSQSNASIVLKGLLVGQVTVKATATDGSVDSNVMTISVVDPVKHVTGISLNKNSTDLIVGKSETLVATITPSDADNQGVEWSIVGTSGIIFVDSNGKVTALATGTATVRATSKEYSSIYADCVVTVDVQHVTSIEVTGNASMQIGENQTLTATVYPSDAYNKEITWVSSDSSIATVSNGVVVAKEVGEVTITAKSVSDPTITGSLKITVATSLNTLVSLNLPQTIASYKQNTDENSLRDVNDIVSSGEAFSDAYYAVEESDDSMIYRVGDQGVFKFSIPSAMGLTPSKGSITIAKAALSLEYKLFKNNEEVDITTYMETEGEFNFSSSDIGSLFTLQITPLATSSYRVKDSSSTVRFEFKVVKGYNVYSLAELSLFDNSQSVWDDYKRSAGLDGVVATGLVLHNDIKVTSDIVPTAFIWTREEALAYITNHPGLIETFASQMGFGSDEAAVTAATEYFVGSFKDYSTLFLRLSDSDFGIEGNFFSVDFKDLKKVAYVLTWDDYAELMRFNGYKQKDGQWPSLTHSSLTDICGSSCDGNHAQLFGFNTTGQSLKSVTIKVGSNVTINNASFVGNGGVSNENQRNKGSMFMFKIDSVKASFKNIISKEAFSFAMTQCYNDSDNHAYVNTGSGYVLPNNYCINVSLSLDRCTVYDVYNTALYLFGTINNTVTNSWLSKAGGPLILLDEPAEEFNGDNPRYLYKASCDCTNVYAFNPVTGSEPWFAGHGAAMFMQSYLVNAGDTETSPGTANGWFGAAALGYSTYNPNAKTFTGLYQGNKVVNLIAMQMRASEPITNSLYPVQGSFTLNNGTKYKLDMSEAYKTSRNIIVNDDPEVRQDHMTTAIAPDYLSPFIVKGSSTSSVALLDVIRNTGNYGDYSVFNSDYMTMYVDGGLSGGSEVCYLMAVFLGTFNVTSLVS